MKTSLYSLLLPALIAGAALVPAAARAQESGDTAPSSETASVSLEAANVPISRALKTLFQAAGVRNFTVDADVQGMVNASLKDVPFALALKQVLSLAAQPLVADVQNGSYHVHRKPRLSPSAAASRPEDAPADPSPGEQSQIYKTGIAHYDARAMADLITRKDGIILVPSNVVTLGNAAAPGPLGGSGFMTLGGGAFGPGQPTANGAQTGPFPGSSAIPTANNVMPDGIRRIFALQSDNSLVIETGTASPPAAFGSPFAGPGYNAPGYNTPGYNAPGYNAPGFSSPAPGFSAPF